MHVRTLLLFFSATLGAQTALAQQVRATSTNNVTACTMITEPTAQRLCIESTLQSRPASTFDPTAEKLRMERRPPVGRDAMSPATKLGQTANKGIAPGTHPVAAPKATTSEAYRNRTWRLQIP